MNYFEIENSQVVGFDYYEEINEENEEIYEYEEIDIIDE